MKKILIILGLLFLLPINLYAQPTKGPKVNEWAWNINEDEMTDEETISIVYTNLSFFLFLAYIEDSGSWVIGYNPSSNINDIEGKIYFKFENDNLQIRDIKDINFNNGWVSVADNNLLNLFKNNTNVKIQVRTTIENGPIDILPLKGFTKVFNEALQYINK